MNLIAYFLVFFGALLRLIDHPANFTPLAAIALFGAVYLSRKEALALPLVALVLSDIFIGFDSLVSRLVVYGSFILMGLIGLAVKRNKNIFTVVGGTVAASTLFFLLTNFTLFYPELLYTHDLNGIVTSYANALPFFRNTLLGDLFYTGLLFGAYEAVALYAKKRQLAFNAR